MSCTPGFDNFTLYVSVNSDALPENPLKERESGGIADRGRRTLLDVMHVRHCLHISARGIFGSGREARLDSCGTDGRRRGLGSKWD